MNALDHRHSDEWKCREHSIFQTMSELAANERKNLRRMIMLAAVGGFVLGFLFGILWR